MRLIDADALKEDCRMANDCKDCKTYVRDCEYDRIYTKMDFCGWLDDAPTVDAVPTKRGYWKMVTMSEATGYDPELSGNDPPYGHVCSVCKHEAHINEEKKEILSNFCPDCGARMDWKDGDYHD